ncbi:MAG: hypothetical protein JO206_08890 [Solirubrobacterales bacterium]|nr:hypothetical protein [Solirubrobacterales bacterium]
MFPSPSLGPPLLSESWSPPLFCGIPPLGWGGGGGELVVVFGGGGAAALTGWLGACAELVCVTGAAAELFPVGIVVPVAAELD